MILFFSAKIIDIYDLYNRLMIYYNNFNNLYENKYISRKEYTRLINIATNCGPLFILGAVSVSLLKNSKYGIILLISNYFSLLIIGLLTIKNSDINNSNIHHFENP